MKQLKTIVNGILTVTVAALLVQCNGKDGANGPGAGPAFSDSLSFRLPVAYIRTDSLLNNYNFSKDINEQMMKEIEDQRINLYQRQQKLQKEAEEFERKVQMNAYISQERAQQEYTRINRQQDELKQYADRIQQEFAAKQAGLQQQLQDTILSQIKAFNTPKKYEMIFSNIGSDNFFYIDEKYDITAEVIEFLNSRYVPAKQ